MHYLSRTHLGPELIANLAEVQREVLGPEELVTSERPKGSRGEYTGGIAFERVDNLTGVKKTRCYTVGPSTQAPRVLTSPSAGGKVPDSGLTPELLLRQKIVKV